MKNKIIFILLILVMGCSGCTSGKNNESIESEKDKIGIYQMTISEIENDKYINMIALSNQFRNKTEEAYAQAETMLKQMKESYGDLFLTNSDYIDETDYFKSLFQSYLQNNLFENDEISNISEYKMNETVTNSNNKFISALKHNGSKKFYVDTKYYIIYDEEGNSVYPICNNEKCTNKEYTSIDLDKYEVLKHYKNIYKMKIEDIPYNKLDELKFVNTDDKNVVNLTLYTEFKNDNSCFFVTRIFSTRKDIYSKSCTYSISDNDDYIYVTTDEYVSIPVNTKNYPLNVEVTINNDKYKLTNELYSKLKNDELEYVLYDQESNNIYDLNGIELNRSAVGYKVGDKIKLDLSKYNILDN